MPKILVDTNIVIDLLSKRENFYKEAQELFSLSEKETILYVSALTFANTYYLLSKYLKPDKTKEILKKFKLLVKVLELNNKIIELALESDFKDFEDAIQYCTALENDIDFIITRNKKDFKKSKIPVMNAKEYLQYLIV